MTNIKRLLSVILLLIVTLPLYAANDTIPRVTGVENLSSLSKAKIPDLRREDYVKLWVSNLSYWMSKRPKDAEAVLYIDKIAFRDLSPVFIDTCDNFMIFKFQKDTTDERAWAFFYKRPRTNVIRNAVISTGWSTDCGLDSDARVNLVVIIKAYRTWGLVGIALFIVIFIWLAYTKDILRDESSLEDKRGRPFSLSRTQFSFWTILIASSFVFLWVSTGETPVLSNASLILLGISGGTSILAKMIDNSQQSTARHQDQQTKGFFTDILSDDKGISIHRFQMLIFTIVTGIIFIHDVLTVFEMPEFNDTLLLLMGISNGTYAGFKATENNSTAVNTKTSPPGT